MIVRIQGPEIQLDQVFTTIEAAVKYLKNIYASHNGEVMKNEWDDVDEEYVVEIRYYNPADEFTMTFNFVNLIPIA